MRVNTYSILLDVDSKSHSFVGHEKISLHSDNEQIILNSVDLNIERIGINGKNIGFVVDKEKEEVVLDGKHSGENELEIDFRGKIVEALTGLYLANTAETEFYTTQFESSGARRVFPSIDNPGYKAGFKLALKIEKDLDAISNMPVKSEREENGKKVIEFEQTPRMSTYLLYIGIGKFDSRSRKYKDVDIILSAPKGHLTEFDYPIEVAEKSLKFYENYFGIDYVLPKMHLISVPEFAAGAMENWGAITFREVLLMVDESTSTAIRKTIAEVIAHEIAHQWFGNLVTMKWWNDLWLNESFATFMSYKTVDHEYPKWDMWGDFLIAQTSGAMSGDSLKNSHPIDVEVKNPNEVANIFDEISYGKGGSILRMIESYVGHENFRGGIRKYLNDHLYENAYGIDLWDSIGDISDQPVNKIMSAWIKKKGYPVIKVDRKGDKIHLTQNQFFLGKETSNETWPIPLTVMRNGKTESILFEGKEMEIESRNFIKLNVDQTGFYRVLYDEESMQEILSSLDKLSNLDKWGLANDLYAFLMSGRLPLEKYVESIKSFEKDTNYLVVEEISGQLSKLYLILPDNKSVLDLARKFYRSQLDRLGDKKAGESENDSILRGNLNTNLSMMDVEWAEKLSKEFARFDSVDPDLRQSVALSYAIVSGDVDSLRDRLEKAKSDEDRIKIIGAMGGLQDREKLSSIIDLIEGGKIKKQDSLRFYVSAAMNPKGREFMFENLNYAVEQMQKVFIGTSYTGMMLEMALPYLGLGRVSEAKKFVDNLKSPEVEHGAAKGLEFLDIYSDFASRNK